MRIIIRSTIAALVAAGLLAAPAIAGQTYQTDLGFQGADDDALFTRFHGDVDVEGPAGCYRDRIVNFYRQQDGKDDKLSTTRSDTYAFWSLEIPDDVLVEGIYYAKTPKAKLNNGAVCTADKSNAILFA